LEPFALTVIKAAEVLGVKRATLLDVLNDHANVSAEMALRLEKAFGMSMGLLQG
jgi:addiction module HigA family antidote